MNIPSAETIKTAWLEDVAYDKESSDKLVISQIEELRKALGGRATRDLIIGYCLGLKAAEIQLLGEVVQ